MKNFTKKIILTAVFILVTFFSFHHFVLAGPIVNTSNIGSTSVTLSASGLSDNTVYSFQITNQTTFASDTVTFTTPNMIFTHTSNLIGLSPNTQFMVALTHNAIAESVIYFTTLPLNTESLSVTSQTTNSVTLKAEGLNIGEDYQISIWTTSNVFQFSWDLNNVASNSITTTSPSTNPIPAGTYVAKLDNQASQLVATSAPFTISAVLTVTAQTATSVTLQAVGLTVGEDYRINIFTAANVLQFGWDINNASNISVTSTSPSTNPLSPGSYVAKLLEVVPPQIIATSASFTITTSTPLPNPTPAPVPSPPAPAQVPNSNPTPNSNPNNQSSNIVPCGTERETPTPPDVVGKIKNPCDFKYFLKLVNNVVRFILFKLAVPLAAIMFCYAGFLLLTAGGESAHAKEKAKKILWGAVKGLVLAAAAWLIISLILTTLGYDGSWIGF